MPRPRATLEEPDMETAASATPAVRPTAAPAEAVRYRIDPVHATAQFKVRHLMVANVRGELGEVTGELVFDPAVPSRSTVRARVDVTGLDTRNADRDTHLRSPDFLDVANHPALTFRSTAVRPAGAGEYQVDGELTIRGKTNPVTLAVEVSDE